MRILKKAENPKYDVKIHNNIFKTIKNEPKATLTFEENNVVTNINWNMRNKEICPIKIYDTQMAKRFVEESNELIYEPKILSVFTNMALVLEEIIDEIIDNIENCQKALIVPDKEIEDALLIKEYEEIKTIKLLNDLKEKLNLSDEEILDLENINKNLKDSNLEETRKILSNQVEFLNIIKKEINDLTISLDKSNVLKYLSLKQEKDLLKKDFDHFVNLNKSISLLNGFGSDKWKNMWKVAKEYSVEENSMKNSDKPICVLCQQELSCESIKRMKSFDDIYKSDISQKYEDTLKKYDIQLKKIEEIISKKLNISIIELNLEAKALSDEIKQIIIEIYKELFNRANWIYMQEDDDIINCPDIVDISTLNQKFNEIFDLLNKRIDSIEKFSKNVEEQVEKRKNILSKKWLIENTKNFDIKNKILNLEIAKAKCKTNSITILKKELSKIIITDAYIEKFNKELELLNNNIKQIFKEDICTKNLFNYIELRRNPLGEPMIKSQFAKTKFKSSISVILNETIPNLKKILKEGNYESYDLQVKGLCSEIRDVVEKRIETTLLSGVVLRHEKNISSQKIRYLKALTELDIDLFNDLMTKYSYYDHSWSTEKPISLPNISDIENDMNKLVKWFDEFSLRKNKYN